MFYTKQLIGKNSELITYITEKNVFTHCPHCNTEVPVDLKNVLLHKEVSDLSNTAVYCRDCAISWLRKKFGIGAKNEEY